MKTGIYCIENIINGKKYIGQSRNIKLRMNVKHFNSIALLNAIKTYGKENFKNYILIYCEEWELNRLEIEYIKLLKSHFLENGYNISFGGECVMVGRKHSKSTKEKMSISRKGKNHPLFGTHLSDNTKKKISDSHKGKTLSEEHKNKIKGHVPWNKGIGKKYLPKTKKERKPVSEESKVLMRLNHPDFFWKE